MESIDISSLQKELVETLKAKKYIQSEAVENAFLKVPRHLFLPDTELTHLKIATNARIIIRAFVAI